MTAVAVGRRSRIWLRIFGWASLLWLLSAVVTYLTGNVLLILTLVLLGSFLVPVTFATWALTRVSGEVSTALLFGDLLRRSPWLYVGVGLIKEAVKLAALALCGRRLYVRSMGRCGTGWSWAPRWVSVSPPSSRPATH